MTKAGNSQITRTITLLITIFSLSLPAYAKYSGGTGETHDPYQIATAEDLMLLGESPEDYDKHFILTADIDLDPNLPGRKVFDRAVIAPDWEMDFTGVFDGNDHIISNLTFDYDRSGLISPPALFGGRIYGSVKNLRLVKPTGDGGFYFGLLAYSLDHGTISNCHVQDCNFSGIEVGGLVQSNSGTIIDCHVSGQINAGGHAVGGLVGHNRDDGTITRCSFSGSVMSEYWGGSKKKGGLVGVNQGGIAFCYSTGYVAGGMTVGGLVGENSGVVYCCYSTCSVSFGGGIHSDFHRIGGLVGTGGAAKSFWDIDTSGLMSSSGGTGLTTAEMKMAKTFLDAGWDFLGETANGTEDIWWILEGQDYPKLLCECSPPWSFWPDPYDAATDVNHSPILSWHGGRGTLYHDVFFGDGKEMVANATPDTPEIYKGRQAMEMTTFNPGILEWGKTYYWRIDEVNEADPCSPWKGKIWSFTTADYIITFVVDDFESYTNDPSTAPFLYFTWISGRLNGTGSNVWPFPAEQTIVHNGRQSMGMDYGNLNEPWYSEIERTWETPQDWTVDGADTLTLYFHGQVSNGPDPLYVCIENSTGLIAVVICPVPDAVQVAQWQRWDIDLADIRSTGVDLSSVQKMYIGIGNRDNHKPGGTGRIYIDDIWLTFRNLILDEFYDDTDRLEYRAEN